MAKSTLLQQSFDELVVGFLCPLLGGGTIQLGRPIGPSALAHFELARPSDSDAEWRMLDALHAAASGVAPLRAQPRLDAATLALAMACHDLLLLTDPELETWPAKRARPVIAGWIDQLVARAGFPTTRTDALVRHAIVDRMLDVTRTDVVVKNWAYTYRFFGRPVPPRVVSMPRLRFVRKTEQQRSLGELVTASGPELERRLSDIVVRSPLTALLRWARTGPIQLDAGIDAVLSDPVLRSAVARELATRDIAAAADAWAPALLALARTPDASPTLAYHALALIFEAHVFGALERDERVRGATGRGPFAAVLPMLLGTALGVQFFASRSDDTTRIEARAAVCRSASDETSTQIVTALIASAERHAHARDVPLEAVQ